MEEEIRVDNVGLMEQNREVILKSNKYLRIEIVVGKDNPLPYVTMDCKEISPYQEGIIAISCMKEIIKFLLDAGGEENMLELLNNVKTEGKIYRARGEENGVSNDNDAN